MRRLQRHLATHGLSSSGSAVTLKCRLALAQAVWAAAQACYAEDLQRLLEELLPECEVVASALAPALWIAAGNDHVGAVRVLVDAAADVNHTNSRALSPLWRASFSGSADAACALLQAQALIDGVAAGALVHGTPAIAAAAHGHWELLQVLVDAKADVHVAMAGGHTALSHAARQGHCDAVGLLLGAKADADAPLPRREGHTPMYAAAMLGHVGVLVLLAHSKAGVNYAPLGGGTPVFVAAQHGHHEAVEALVRAKADVNMSTRGGRRETPMCAAARGGHHRCVEALARARADVNAAARHGCGSDAPVLLAASRADAATLAALAAAKADLDVARADPMVLGLHHTPACVLAELPCDNGCLDSLNVLAQAKADLDKAGEHGWTPACVVVVGGGSSWSACPLSFSLSLAQSLYVSINQSPSLYIYI